MQQWLHESAPLLRYTYIACLTWKEVASSSSCQQIERLTEMLGNLLTTDTKTCYANGFSLYVIYMSTVQTRHGLAQQKKKKPTAYVQRNKYLFPQVWVFQVMDKPWTNQISEASDVLGEGYILYCEVCL